MKSLIWIFALMLTAAAGIFQRVTGPTHPVISEVNTGLQRYPVKFLRSHSGISDCPVVLQISDIAVKGVLLYRKYPSRDEMTKVELKREGDKLSGSIPNQPPAGKIEYRVDLVKNGIPLKIGGGTPIIIRFTGEVPQLVLIIHIFLMFLAMFLSNVTGMMALFKTGYIQFMAVFTFIILMIGGLILGPVVQKYAFNEWWAGIPYGWDLTDNKTLIAILVWLTALAMIRKKNARLWIIAASVVTIVVFSIPHSLYGSQLNQETGKIIQGFIVPYNSIFLK